jgi:hypothetical protein
MLPAELPNLPPLWSSGQSSWLQIPGLIPGATRFSDFLERGLLSLVSTIEELLGRKSSGSGLENLEYGRVSLTMLHRLSSKV